MNPYKINEPTAISFSGGRSSAYMLHKVLEVNGGIPENSFVAFANTGKEMPQTLDFVRDCAERWGVDIVWLELGDFDIVGEWKSGRHKGKPRFKAQTVRVDYETASRDGEPFTRLIQRKKYPPNIKARFCTAELKVRRVHQYGNTIQVGGVKHQQFIGIRGDEPRRALKLHGKIEAGRETYLPLWVDRVTKEDVGDFWKSQSFDLQLPNNNGVTDWGNCDLCYLKGKKKRMSIMKLRPDLADWWIEQEKKTGNQFSKDFSYSDMLATSKAADDLGFDDPSFPCFCGD